MKRGEIWTIAGGGEFTGKLRPAVIVQDDNFHATASVTICAFTTDPTVAPLFHIRVEPTEENGLQEAGCLMVDKLTTVRKRRIGSRVGRLDDEDIVRLNRAIFVYHGLASSPGK